jgi:hypothetical protein
MTIGVVIPQDLHEKAKGYESDVATFAACMPGTQETTS